MTFEEWFNSSGIPRSLRDPVRDGWHGAITQSDEIKTLRDEIANIEAAYEAAQRLIDQLKEKLHELR